MTLPKGSQAPKLLQTIQWIANPFGYMEACAQQYGDIFTGPLGNKFESVVYVSNPNAIQEILSPDSQKFDAPGEAGLNQLFQPFLGDNSLITLSNDRHRRQRQLSIASRSRNYCNCYHLGIVLDSQTTKC